MLGLEDKEEKEKYKRFLEYCEEKRREWRKQEEEDTARKEDAKRKEENWKLLRESISFLKKNESKWQHRKIKEVERIKNEEKADRLAISRQKKKKYGIKQLNKEENRRIKERTEERIHISQAKANYWKTKKGRRERLEGDEQTALEKDEGRNIGTGGGRIMDMPGGHLKG